MADTATDGSRDAGWQINDTRGERLWRREGLKVPMKQLKNGSGQMMVPASGCVLSVKLDGQGVRTLNILDEHSRECLAIRVKRKLNSADVIDALSDLFILRGVPSCIRSDSGPEFIAQAVHDRIKAVGAKTASIQPDSPSENGYCGNVNARFRDAFLNGEIFYRLREAQVLIEAWRKHQTTPQCSGLPPTGSGHHRPDRPKASQATTLKPDNSTGANQMRPCRQ